MIGISRPHKELTDVEASVHTDEVAQIVVGRYSSGPVGHGEIFHVSGTGCDDCLSDEIRCLRRDCSFRHSKL